MHKKVLESVGLKVSEAIAYEKLLSHEELTPPELADVSTITRTNSYAVLQSLKEKGIVTEYEKRGKLTYRANSPESLKTYANMNLRQHKNNVRQLETMMPNLVSKYDILTDKIGSRSYDGIEGLNTVFEDVLREKHNFYLITANFESKRKSVLQNYSDFITTLKSRGIKTSVLVPHDADFNYKFFSKFTSDKLEVKRIPKEHAFELGSEIIIYGNNIALISLKNDFHTVQIDSRDIAQTLKTLFMAFWHTN
jgi:sugar-specific transcriptional regulator TrmB